MVLIQELYNMSHVSGLIESKDLFEIKMYGGLREGLTEQEWVDK